MAENVVINIEANTSGLQQTIDMLVKMGLVTEDAAKKFKTVNDQTMAGLAKSSAQAKSTFEGVSKAIDNIKKDNGLAQALDVSKPLAQVGTGITTLKSQLKAATIEAQNLAEQFGELDPRTLAAAKRAGELSDKIGDVNDQIAALKPEGKFQAIQKFGQSIQGIFQIATGALQAFGIENEKAKAIAERFQAALNVTQGLSSLAGLKDSFTALSGALGIARTSAVATGVALEAEGAAATGAAVANEGFAASLSATGIGGIVVAIGAIIGAMVLLGDTSKETADNQKKLNDELQRTKDLRAGLAVDIKDAEIQLALARNQISQEEAQRRQLALNQQTKNDEFDKNLKNQYESFANTNRQAEELQKRILSTEESLAKGTIGGQAAATAGKFVDQQKKELQALQDRAAKEYELFKNTATAKFESNQVLALKTQALDATEENRKKQEADRTVGRAKDVAKKTIDLEKVVTNEDKYKNALGIINQYYKQQELLILKSGKSEKETQDDILNNEIARLTEQLAAAKLTYQDYTQLEIDLQNLIKKRDKLPEVTAKLDTSVSEAPEYVKKGLAKIKELKGQFEEQLIQSGGELITSYFDSYIDNLTRVTEKQREELDQQEQDLQKSYDNRLIGRRELEAQEQIINQKKADLDKKLKLDQARADKEKALFDVLINTAASLVRVYIDPGFTAAPFASALILGIAAAQAAAIAAAPLPKYKKGTLSVPGIGSEDTHHALLTPGEAVIPKDTNARYKEAISAIYHNKVSPQDINAYVRMKLKGDYSSSNSKPSSVTARMDSSDIYTLGKMLKKNDGVYIKNIGELASIFQSMHNPRR